MLDHIKQEPTVYASKQVEKICTFAISNDSKMIAIGQYYQGNIEILNIVTLEVMYYFNCSTNYTYCLQFSNDSRTLAQSGFQQCQIVLCNLETQEQTELIGHQQRVCRIVFIDDDQLATSSFDKTVKIWNYKNLNLISTIQVAGVSIDLQFWGEKQIFITNSKAQIRLFDLKTGKVIKQFQSLTCLSHFCQLNKQSGIVLVSGEQKKSKIFCLRNSKQIRKFNSEIKQVTNTFFPKTEFCIISTLEEIIVWNYCTGSEVYRKQIDYSNHPRLGVDSQCNYLALGGLTSRELYIWKLT